MPFEPLTPTTSVAPALGYRSPRDLTLLLVLVLSLVPSLLRAADEPARHAFELSAGAAEPSLKRFSEQSGHQVLFPTDLVKNVRTNAVRGTLTAREALERLLADTGLSASQDAATGAFAIRSESKEKNVASRPALSGAALTEHRDGTVKLQSYEVTGSRIRGVLGEATVQPVITYTAAELEDLGVQVMTDLNTYIPQLPTIAWESTPETGITNLANNGGRVNFNGGLRNLGNTATLLLINGRRAPKLGTAMGLDSYDLSGVPVSAIERIEVLTDGASAVYGSDALAGVINVILKKNYRGSQLSVTYGNTFDSDTGFTNVQLASGYSTGRLALNVSANWSKTNSLSPRDRWFSASNDRRPLGGTDGRGIIREGPGSIRTVSGANLPGLASPEAPIPPGSTGVNLTVADFANAGAMPDLFDAPKYQVFGDRGNKGVTLRSEYEFKPTLTAFVEGSWNELTSYRPGNPTTVSVQVPAGYPGNPFGVPIFVRRAYWEMMPLLETNIETVTHTVLTGVRGLLPHDWRYEVGIQRQQSQYSVTGAGGGGSFGGTTALQAAINDVNRRPIVLNDGTVNSPNSFELLKSMLLDGGYSERPLLWTYDAKADGPIWTLPAGEIKAAIGIERQEEYANFRIPANDVFGRLARSVSRSANGIFAEVQVPLVSDKKPLPLVHRASLSLSARRDDYSDFGAQIVPRFGLFYYPHKSVALRASVGKGYKAPTLSQTYAPERNSPVSVGLAANIFDPERNGEQVVGPLNTFQGGNLNLNPEESENLNLGLVVEIPFVKGLSFSVDYYEIKQTDRVGSGLGDIISNFPERLTRAERTPDDIALNIPGKITSVDQRSINLASYEAAGFDYQLKYLRTIQPLGNFSLRLTANDPKRALLQGAPRSPVVNNLPGGYWRGTGTLNWTRGPLGAGVTATYTSPYVGRYFPGGQYFNNNTQFNKEVLLWDAMVSYDLSRGKWQARDWKRHLLSDLRFTANVYNVLEKEPDLTATKTPILGTIDPRGRRYQVSLQKKF
ncbi:MAG: TonB-dependent receptor [Opitutaceae bacterium]